MAHISITLDIFGVFFFSSGIVFSVTYIYIYNIYIYIYEAPALGTVLKAEEEYMAKLPEKKNVIKNKSAKTDALLVQASWTPPPPPSPPEFVRPVLLAHPICAADDAAYAIFARLESLLNPCASGAHYMCRR